MRERFTKHEKLIMLYSEKNQVNETPSSSAPVLPLNFPKVISRLKFWKLLLNQKKPRIDGTKVDLRQGNNVQQMS